MKTKKLILLIATILVAVGCSSRKSEINKYDIKTKDVVTDNSNITTNENSNLKVTNNTETNKDTGEETETEILEPIDNTKSATYVDENGKSQSLNNTKKTKTKTRRKTNEKSKSNVVVDKDVKVAKKQQNNVKTKSKANIQVKEKKTEKEQFNLLSLWWLYLLIALMIYIGYKKRKELFL